VPTELANEPGPRDLLLNPGQRTLDISVIDGHHKVVLHPHRVRLRAGCRRAVLSAICWRRAEGQVPVRLVLRSLRFLVSVSCYSSSTSSP
jgi:hypothetical protein